MKTKNLMTLVTFVLAMGSVAQADDSENVFHGYASESNTFAARVKVRQRARDRAMHSCYIAGFSDCELVSLSSECERYYASHPVRSCSATALVRGSN